MHFYILRHSETDQNVHRCIQGSSDIPLNENGIHLARQTRDGFAKAGLSFDRLLSSPLIRALKTAEIVNEYLKLPLCVDERLCEMGFGKYEGMSLEKDEFLDDNIRNYFVNPPLYQAPPDGESFEQVHKRLHSFLEDEIYPLRDTNQSVLIVCHGAVIRGLFMELGYLKLTDIWSIKQYNCALNHFELTRDGCFLVAQNQTFYEVPQSKKRGIF